MKKRFRVIERKFGNGKVSFYIQRTSQSDEWMDVASFNAIETAINFLEARKEQHLAEQVVSETVVAE